MLLFAKLFNPKPNTSIEIANNKFDLAWDILDEAFDSFIHVHAWILTESNPEYSIYTKELYKLVEKYERVMYNPFRNFDWANKRDHV